LAASIYRSLVSASCVVDFALRQPIPLLEGRGVGSGRHPIRRYSIAELLREPGFRQFQQIGRVSAANAYRNLRLKCLRSVQQCGAVVSRYTSQISSVRWIGPVP
jgi:hypothetical protein